jgi:hypothetical protein
LKNIIFNIRNTNFFIEIKYWKGNDFYSYDVNYIKIYNKDFSVSDSSNDSLRMEDCLDSLPEEAQLEILMNLDLFARI